MDTIFALATAQGRAGVAVIRISGPSAFDVAHALIGDVPQTRYAALRKVQDASGEVIDEALALSFTAPASFTGEDVVELHLHGSPAIVRAVLQRLGQLDARLAEPGEFTLRAFLNGRLDLTQAESVADLVGARSPQAAQTALAGIQGKLASSIRELRTTCLDILA